MVRRPARAAKLAGERAWAATPGRRAGSWAGQAHRDDRLRQRGALLDVKAQAQAEEGHHKGAPSHASRVGQRRHLRGFGAQGARAGQGGQTLWVPGT